MNVYTKVFRYVSGEKLYGFLAVAFSVISALLTVWGYFFLYEFLYALLVWGDSDIALLLAIKTAAVLTAGGLLYMLAALCSHVLGFRVETNLRKRGIEGLTNASMRFFDLHSSGTVRKIIDDNATQTHMVVAHLIPDNAQALAGPVGAILLGFTISARLGGTLLLLALLCGGFLYFMMGNRSFLKMYQEALERLGAETVEYVRGMPVVKIFGAGLRSFASLSDSIASYAKYAYDYSKSCRLPYVCYQWLFFGLPALFILWVPFFPALWSVPEVLAVELVMLVFLSGVLFVSFMRIMYLGMYIFQGNYAIDTLEDLYGKMRQDSLSFGGETVFTNYDIEFDRVTFGYKKEKPVLENLSFRLKAGKRYALVGGSGGGKSTVAKLIAGFYQADSGTVRIGGKPLQAYTREALINAVAFVFQDAKLFKKTLYENVALARKDATKEQVLEAMELAGCRSILEKLPEREHTRIGSKGIYLSGGEKQRIAIARAILKDAPVVIMDEASAAIDPDNEHELQKAFRNLMEGRTVIMIAHRLSSIRSVDEILVMENGKLTEKGTDAGLMGRDTRYRRLVEMYNSANEWRVGDAVIL